jgi:hypothetical protein
LRRLQRKVRGCGKRIVRELTYKIRDSIEASRGWTLSDFIRLSRLGAWLVSEGAMALICVEVLGNGELDDPA